MIDANGRSFLAPSEDWIHYSSGSRATITLPNNTQISFGQASPREISTAVEFGARFHYRFGYLSENKRIVLLLCIAHLLREYKESLAQMMALETGFEQSICEKEIETTANEAEGWATKLPEIDVDRYLPDTSGSGVLRRRLPDRLAFLLGPSNYPVKESPIVGDLALAAIAAGIPFIACSNEEVRGLHEMLARLLLEALKRCGIEGPYFQFFHEAGDMHILKREVVANPELATFAIVGSEEAGKSLHRNSHPGIRPNIFASGPHNPHFVFANWLEQNVDNWVTETADLFTNRAMQRCSAPGLIVMHSGQAYEEAKSGLDAALTDTSPMQLISPRHKAAWYQATSAYLALGAEVIAGRKSVTSGDDVFPLALELSAEALTKAASQNLPLLFGPTVVLVPTPEDEFSSLLEKLPRQHGGLAIYATQSELYSHAGKFAEAAIRLWGGRLAVNTPFAGTPGVAKVPAIQVSLQGTTKIGPGAIEMFMSRMAMGPVEDGVTITHLFGH